MAIEPGAIKSLLDAARLAPSSYNEQPWRFIIARREKPADFEKMLGILFDVNARWAENAPLLILVAAKLFLERDKKPNRHALHDVGLAVGNLVAQATSLGIYARQLGGFDVDNAQEQYAIPDGYEPVSIIALGYLGDEEGNDLDDRDRMPVSAFVYEGEWGTPSTLDAR